MTALLALVCAAVVVLPGRAHAQTETPPAGRVQEFAGRIESGQLRVYLVPGLKEGETLYAHLQNVSGDLDPSLGVLDAVSDFAATEAAYSAEVARLIASGQDIATGLTALRDRYFLAWDDDGGGGYSAALQFPVPTNGDYRVIIAGALSTFGRATFGEYRLLIGVNAPQVLTGRAPPTGDDLASLDRTAIRLEESAQEITGTLTVSNPVASYSLVDLMPGDTLYASVVGASGESAPALVLRDFGGKPVDAANLEGQQARATIERPLTDGGVNYSLEVTFPTSGLVTSQGATLGAFRLQAGVNVSEAARGQATPIGNLVFKLPITVNVGLQLQQIVQINQEDEYFAAVGSMRMDWTDPALAFSPDSCQCQSKIYTEKEFDRFLGDVAGRWPDFTFQNQQGNRWIQNRAVVVRTDGSASYFERFSTNFQVDFNFQKFPFDVQQFQMRVEMLYPDTVYVLSELPGYSGISPENGEDEFILSDFQTVTSRVDGITGRPTSRFTFQFEAPRQLTYYTLQIFVPILLITLIAWVTFFLRDFTKRAEVAAANVLLFIAFSFSLADNYPHLGYLTFLDAIMVATFIINTLVVLYNVYLKWLENSGRLGRAERIDRIMDWLYPVSYLAAMATLAVVFL
jgi:hypothetical protein